MKTSPELFEKALEIFVGGVNSPVRSFNSVGGNPYFIKRGEGAYLYTEEGKSFIDYVLSWGPLLFGHAHPDIVSTIQKVAVDGTSFGAPCKYELDLAELIQYFFPSCEKIRFVSSGTESTMSAIRLARGYTGKKKIIKFNGCYHGHIDALLVQAGSGGLTFGHPNSAGVLPEIASQTLLCEFNDIEGLKKLFHDYKDDIAAVILEPVVGNMGTVLPKDHFLSELRDLCTQNQTLLIFDEVMTGFRVTPGGVQSLYKIKPDITCLAKVMGGGLPCAAFGGRKEIMDYLSPTGPVYHAGTLSGNPLAMSAGIAMLKILKDQPEKYLHAEKMTSILVNGIKDILKKKGLKYQINNIGTMFTLFFTERPVNNLKDAKTCDTSKYSHFFQELLKRGVYFAPSQFEANFMSSAHSEKEINITLKAIDEALT